MTTPLTSDGLRDSDGHTVKIRACPDGTFAAKFYINDHSTWGAGAEATGVTPMAALLALEEEIQRRGTYR